MKEYDMEADFASEQSPPKGERKLLTFKLVDEPKLDDARSILRGRQLTKSHVQGTIVKSKAPYNPE
jgi:hypothetical protein